MGCSRGGEIFQRSLKWQHQGFGKMWDTKCQPAKVHLPQTLTCYQYFSSLLPFRKDENEANLSGPTQSMCAFSNGWRQDALRGAAHIPPMWGCSGLEWEPCPFEHSEFCSNRFIQPQVEVLWVTLTGSVSYIGNYSTWLFKDHPGGRGKLFYTAAILQMNMK